ncbi:hypothetical protein PFISCL1PPCAC_19200, partial [Pristionchus fissidentatus]
LKFRVNKKLDQLELNVKQNMRDLIIQTYQASNELSISGHNADLCREVSTNLLIRVLRRIVHNTSFKTIGLFSEEDSRSTRILDVIKNFSSDSLEIGRTGVRYLLLILMSI